MGSGGAGRARSMGRPGAPSALQASGASPRPLVHRCVWAANAGPRAQRSASLHLISGPLGQG